MTGYGPAWPPRAGEALRWGASLVVILALHAGLVVLLTRVAPVMDVPPPAPQAVLLDLPPDSAPMPEPISEPKPAPLPVPLPEPPPPEPPPPEPPPPEPPPPEPPSPPQPAVVLPRPPPPPRPRQPPPHPVPARPVPQAPAPAPAPSIPAAPPVAAAPPPPSSNAVPNWRSELIGKLQRAKRYPDTSRSRGDQGVAAVTFTMDRTGRVLSANLARSSGHSGLDDEAVAMVHRAEPLPAMPAEMQGTSVTLTVPVSFTLR